MKIFIHEEATGQRNAVPVRRMRGRLARLVAAMICLCAFHASPASAAQPVRVHPQNPYILEFRGQPTLLRTWGATFEWVFDSTLPFIPYLDVLHRDGMNLTRVWCLGYPSYYPERFIQPWPRTTASGTGLDGLGKFDFSTWNEDYFVRLKAFVQAASDRGIVVEVTLLSTFYSDSEWRKSPFHPSNNVQGYGPNNRYDTMREVDANLLAVQQSAVRRIASELNGFDNVYYEIQNEPFWNEPGIKDSQEVTFQNGMLGAIRDEESGLPNRHLVAHNFPQQVATMSTGFDIINEHYPAAVPATTIAGAESLLNNQYSRGKILSLDETNTTNELQTRLESWMFLIGGGGIYDGLDANEAVYSSSDHSGDNALGNAMRGTVRNIGTYMDRLELTSLRRNLAWVNGGIPSGATLQASASPDHQYVAYLHHGQKGVQNFQLNYDPIDTTNHNVSLRVALPAGDWRAVWTRPSDLAELHTQSFTHNGGNFTLEQVTYQADVALRIDRITPPPPPSVLNVVSNPDGSITLSWDAIQIFGLAGYDVYRSDAPDVPIDPAHRIAVLPSTSVSFTDSPGAINMTYYYVIKAVDHGGEVLASSIETPAESVLEIPQLRIYGNGGDQLILEWTTTMPDWRLQESPDLTPGSWTDSTLTPTNDGDLYQALITPSDSKWFYRLRFELPTPTP